MMLERLGLGVLSTRALRCTRYGQRRYGGTLTNILADENPPPVQVASVNEQAICLADGRAIPGPCIFLEGKVLLWNVPKTLWDGWDTTHFKVFELAGTRPEILLLGTGKTVSQAPPVIRAYLRSLGINLDVMDSRNASATYNLLAEEGRRVAAALLPLTPYKWQKTDATAKSA